MASPHRFEPQWIRRGAMGLGAAAHLGCAVLWGVLLVANPYSSPALDAWTVVEALGMIGASLLGVWASVTARAGLLWLLFAVEFFSVGLYLAVTPSPFRVIGWLNLTSWVAALLMVRFRGVSR